MTAKKKDVPLQNIPIRSVIAREIRERLLDGYVFVPLDYEGLELRTMAQILSKKR